MSCLNPMKIRYWKDEPSCIIKSAEMGRKNRHLIFPTSSWGGYKTTMNAH